MDSISSLSRLLVGSARDASKTRQHFNVVSVTNHDHVLIFVPAEIEIRRPFPHIFHQVNLLRSDLFTYSAVSRIFLLAEKGAFFKFKQRSLGLHSSTAYLRSDFYYVT